MKISLLPVVALILINILVITACHKSKSAPAPTPAPTPASIVIGQTYAGGIVFHIDSSGQHGLVCAAMDQDTAIIWGRDSVGTMPEDGSFGSGQANTSKIVAVLGPGNYAAYLCDTLKLNGYDDWFLPSITELDSMLRNLAPGGLANFANAEYWSSTPYWPLVTHSGTITDWVAIESYDPSWGVLYGGFYDYSFYHVRAIRAF